jgi:hypothetical protein
MRRVFAFVLLSLFVCQNAASAAMLPENMRSRYAPSFSATILADVTAGVQAFQQTRLGAYMSGRGNRYDAMHAPEPVFDRRTIPTRAPELHVERAGALQVRHQEGVDTAPPLEQRRTRIDRPLQSAGPGLASSSAYSGRKFAAAVATLRKPKLKAMAVDASTPAVTGINPWWTYEEGDIPGVGTWMANVGNGNLVVEATDIAVPERGLDLTFRRTYNSMSQYDADDDDGSVPSVYGNGWTNTLDAHMGYNATTNVISVFDVDGARYDYTWNSATETWSPPAGVWATLTADSTYQCVWDWTQRSGITYLFWSPQSCSAIPASDAAYTGRLYEIQGRNKNNYIRLTYSWANSSASSIENLTEIVATHSDGQQLDLTFGVMPDGHVELQYIERPSGAYIYYTYDSEDNQALTTRPGNNTGAAYYNVGFFTNSAGLLTMGITN